MNREDAKKLWPVIKAYGEGEEIQYKLADGGSWSVNLTPGFTKDFEYRVKPKSEDWWMIIWEKGEVHYSDDFGSKEKAQKFLNCSMGKGRVVHMREVEE